MRTMFAIGFVFGILIIGTLSFALMTGFVTAHPKAQEPSAIAVQPVPDAVMAKYKPKPAKPVVDDSCYAIPECLKWRNAHYPITILEVED